MNTGEISILSRFKKECMEDSAGTRPTFWTRGLAGTRGLASPTEELPSCEVGVGLASLGWTRESQLTALMEECI